MNTQVRKSNTLSKQNSVCFKKIYCIINIASIQNTEASQKPNLRYSLAKVSTNWNLPNLVSKYTSLSNTLLKVQGSWFPLNWYYKTCSIRKKKTIKSAHGKIKAKKLYKKVIKQKGKSIPPETTPIKFVYPLMEYYSVNKKRMKFCHFASTWMDVESIREYYA